MATPATGATAGPGGGRFLAWGTALVSVEARDLRDKVIASDPGLARLRQGVRAAVSVGSTLLVEFGVARLLGVPPLLTMMLGAVVAMLMSTGIRENRRPAVLRAAAGTPVAAALGASMATVAATRHTVGLAVFVVVSFLAVWVRRFGGSWFTYGFLAWQCYFFVLFLHPPLAALPVLLLAIAVASCWVALLLVTALYSDPQAQLRGTVTALRARARAAVAAAIEVLEDPDEARTVRRLQRELARLFELALLFDGQLAESRALPPGVAPARLRRWVVDVEIGMDELVGAVVDLAAVADRAPAQVRRDAVRTLRNLGWGDLPDARRAAAELAGGLAVDSEDRLALITGGLSGEDGRVSGSTGRRVSASADGRLTGAVEEKVTASGPRPADTATGTTRGRSESATGSARVTADHPPAQRADQPPADLPAYPADHPPAQRADHPPAQRADQPPAQRADQPPADLPAYPAAHRLGAAAAFLLVTVETWTSGRLLTAAQQADSAAGREAATGDAGEADEVGDGDTGRNGDRRRNGDRGRNGDSGRNGGDGGNGDGEDGAAGELEGFTDARFEPVVTLSGGNLPGSAALAAEAVSRDDAPWWSPARMSLTTRQAVQTAVAAALAILAGELISTRRFYWAVIAAFIAFTGTSTTAETLRKSTSRVAGTFAGLLAAAVLADVTAGHSDVAVATILVCIFLAFYLQAVSYGAMILFITVMLGQLYTVLHTFTDEVLVLRLEETAVGAAIGVLVSLLVLPASSRSTLRVARKALLDDLATLLEECGRWLSDGEPSKDLMTTVVTLDSSSRHVVRAAEAMVHGRLFGRDRDGLRRRVAVLGVCAATGRSVAAVVAGMPGGTNPGLAQACDELGREARRLAAVPSLAEPPPAQQQGTKDVAARIAPLLDAIEGDADLAPLRRGLRRMADALALLTPRGRAST